MLEALLFCTVVGISDGDTLTARCVTDESAQTVKARLAEIDAPEKAQPFGQRSRQHLADLCFQKQAEVMPQTRDRYGRTVAHVRCAGQDANTEQVRAGMAWVYARYARKGSALHAVQAGAKDERRGLWVDVEPVPPWDWRRQQRSAGL